MRFQIQQILPYMFAFLTFVCQTEAAEITFWHNQEELQRQFVENLVRDFNRSNGASIRGETGLEQDTPLIRELGRKSAPDIMLIPSDLMYLHEQLQFSIIPEDWKPNETANAGYHYTSRRQKDYGIPLVMGSQILLFYNRKLISQPARTWDELRNQVQKIHQNGKGRRGIEWPFYEPFYLIPFLDARGGALLINDRVQLDTPQMRNAFSDYVAIAKDLRVDTHCDQQCLNSGFKNGKIAYLMSGDWASYEMEHALGKDLGIAPLPSFHGKRLRSFRTDHFLVFPYHSIRKNPSVIKKFVHYLQSEGVQRRWLLEAHRLPVHPKVLFSSAELIQRTYHQQLEDILSYSLAPDFPVMLYIWPALRHGIRRLIEENGSNIAKICREMQTLVDKLQREDLRRKKGG